MIRPILVTIQRSSINPPGCPRAKHQSPTWDFLFQPSEQKANPLCLGFCTFRNRDFGTAHGHCIESSAIRKDDLHAAARSPRHDRQSKPVRPCSRLHHCRHLRSAPPPLLALLFSGWPATWPEWTENPPWTQGLSFPMASSFWRHPR